MLSALLVCVTVMIDNTIYQCKKEHKFREKITFRITELELFVKDVRNTI